MDVETLPGLRLEVAGRELSACRGPDQRRRHHWGRQLLGLPAALLLIFLLVPMIWTLVWSLRGSPPMIGNFATILTDPGALAAGWHSLLWVGIALVLIAVGYGIAVLSHLVSGLWRVLLYVLILPFGVSAVVSGAVFRMIFDPNPERGMATALFGDGPVWLGPDLIWLVLASAFAWTWLGFIVVLFHAGLKANPGRRRPGPVTTIVVLTVLVAAIRVFDLVLIVPPGSVQDDADVVGLHWWRMVSRSADTGTPAALAVLLFVIVAAIALFGMRGARQPDQEPEPAPVPAVREAPTKHRGWSWVIGIGLSVFWLLPAVILLATALHEPAAAGASGWWSLTGLSFDSFVALADSWLWPALVGNLFLAGLATALVVAAAAPAAYLLVWGGLPRWLSGALTVLLVVLAVAPVQMYAGPLGDAISGLGLSGARTPLALIHAAAGLPFATLVLKTAFEAAKVRAADERPSLDAMWRRTRYRPAVIAVVVLEFVLVWNDFIVGFLIGGPGRAPFTLLLWGEARQFGTSAGTVAAASVAAAVIPVCVLLISWPRVVQGLTGGASR
jgi:alpha-glucoside transport system permease protein